MLKSADRSELDSGGTSSSNIQRHDEAQQTVHDGTANNTLKITDGDTQRECNNDELPQDPKMSRESEKDLTIINESSSNITSKTLQHHSKSPGISEDDGLNQIKPPAEKSSEKQVSSEGCHDESAHKVENKEIDNLKCEKETCEGRFIVFIFYHIPWQSTLYLLAFNDCSAFNFFLRDLKKLRT